jgi:ligand-binding sensor domain-containing protein/signal transduction histidine kinase
MGLISPDLCRVKKIAKGTNLVRLPSIVLRAFIAAAILFATLAALPAHPAQAQSGSIRFETLSVENGLSQSTVRAIVQDLQGFLWFGTDDGLNKYDGYSFVLYKHDPENKDSLSNSTITALYLDRQGELWIGTASGLDHYNHDETFSHYQHDPANPDSLSGTSVSAIVEDAQGNLWVGTSDGGLNMLDRENGTFTHSWNSPNPTGTLISRLVTAVIADPRGGLWVGTSEGLDYLDQQSGKVTHYLNDSQNTNSLSDNRVLSLLLDRFGQLWIGTEEGGLNRYNSAQNTFIRYQNRPDNPYSLNSNFIRSIYEDKNGRVWVGTRSGLHQLIRPDEYFNRYQHDPNDQHSLSNDYVLSLFTDRSGVLWIGTLGGGLSKYVQTTDRFTLYQHRPGVQNSLSNDIVYAIYEDRQSVVWVGTMDGGLNRLDPEAGTFSVYQHNPMDSYSLSSNDVRAILEDHMAQLWVGTYGGGLNLMYRETGRFRRYNHMDSIPGSLSDNRVTVLFEDRRGYLWVGTRSGGLDKFDQSTGQFIHYRNNPSQPNSLASNYIQAIYEDSAGLLWIGTGNGLSVMNPDTGEFTNYRLDPANPASLANNQVLSILETSDGAMWIGTMMGGLNRLDRSSGVFRHYSQKQGLPGDTIYGILADKNGFLWISTNKGLSRFDTQSETFRNYDRQDGLQSYEFNPGAYYQNSRGRMYFGGVQGFNTFDPLNVQDNPVTPSVVITAFKKFNQTERIDLGGGEKIRLSYQDNFISFEFSALDFSAPEKNQYAYQLVGFDPDWVYSGTRRYVSYTNLRGGHYTFKVIGSNQDGVWNMTGASVEIDIIPPIWQRWWFVGTLALLLMSGAAGGYRLRVMQIQSQTRALEKQVRERTLEIERRREVAEGLREILNILNSNQSLTESLDSIIRQIMRLMEAQAVIIFRCEEEGYPAIIASNLPETANLIPVRNSWQFQARNQPPASLPGWLTLPVLAGQPLLLPHIHDQNSPVQTEIRESFYQSYGAILAVPLAVNDKVDGGLVLLYKKMRVFSEEEIKMAVSFADHAALAIANALLRSQAEEIAVSAERNRLARDLHDAVTQTLFATSLIAEVLPRLWERNPEAGRQKVAEIRELTRGALAEMRTLLMELRPTALEDVPLPDLLQQLSEAFTGRARVPVKLEVDKSIILPPQVKLGFYRITQEALNNIQKHARATQVEIQLINGSEDALLRISDNGIGFDPNQRLPDHFGLGIMEERAQVIGAQYAIETRPGKGAQVTVTWKK